MYAQKCSPNMQSQCCLWELSLVFVMSKMLFIKEFLAKANVASEKLSQCWVCVHEFRQ